MNRRTLTLIAIAVLVAVLTAALGLYTYLVVWGGMAIR